jgi:glutamine amidotransferase
MTLIVIDYQKGNIRSVQKGLELAGVEARVSGDAREIARADALVLPGVGAFADAAAFMTESGQMQAVREALARGVPFLGICLGLHLLLEWGEEGVADVTSRTVVDESWAEGIGAIRGHVRRIDGVDANGRCFKVPHVGWNQIRFESGAKATAELGALFDGIEDGSNFYFTHSYQGVPAERATVLATVTHATDFPCVIGKGAAFGVQFHPEKSSHKGLQVLKNFVRFAKER